MKRRLMPDELRDVFTRCTAREATWQEVDLLKDHVDALEAEIAALKADLDEMTQRSLERAEGRD